MPRSLRIVVRASSLLVLIAAAQSSLCQQAAKQAVIADHPQARARGLVNIEELTDARGNRVRANVFTPEQAAINSEAINLAFRNMQVRGPQVDALYIPGKRFAVGPKIRLNYGYGGGALYGTGSIGDGGNYWTSTNAAAHSALIKVSHFDEPVIEIPTIGARLDGFTIYGWHQATTGTLPGKPITGASNASPIVISSAAHGLATGATVRIAGVVGTTAANGKWTVTRIDNDRFSLDGSAGNGDYARAPTQGVWIAPGITYAAVGVRLARADRGSPNFNTWLGPLSIVGCDTGIAVDFDPGQEGNTDNIYCPKLNFCVFGDCVKVTNRDLTSFVVGHLRVGHHPFGHEATAVSFPMENIFNFRKGGGLNAQFVNANQPCTAIRTADVGTGNQSYEIGTLRFDNDSPRNRVLVMELPRGIRVRAGMQYRDAGAAMTHPWVEWKHRGVLPDVGGYEHPDIEIDCREWRRDQAAGFPRRPIPGWPMPLFFRTSPFSSTKLWLSATDSDEWTVSEQPAEVDPRRTLRHVAAVADRSAAGNHLNESNQGEGPKLWAANFNHRDTLRFHTDVLFNDSPRDFDGATDLEIMFPILFLADGNGGAIIDCTGSRPSAGQRAWGIRATPNHEVQWFQQGGAQGEQVVTSHPLHKETPYLVHVRRIGATGEVFVLVDNAGGQRTGQLASELRPAAAGKLAAGPLAEGVTLSIGGQRTGARWTNWLEALLPDLIVDTALLTKSQLAERKHYLRAAYGVWDGTQLDAPSGQ
jgi:hypothetical protein